MLVCTTQLKNTVQANSTARQRMKSAVLIVLFMALVVGCSPSGQVLTVRQACDAAGAKEKRVTIAGYFIFHSEGDELDLQPGDPTGNGIALLFNPTFFGKKRGTSAVTRTLRGHYDQKYVFVAGMLKRGPIFGAIGMVPDCIFMEVEEIKEADHPPEPPKAYRQFDDATSKKG